MALGRERSSSIERNLSSSWREVPTFPSTPSRNVSRDRQRRVSWLQEDASTTRPRANRVLRPAVDWIQSGGPSVVAWQRSSAAAGGFPRQRPITTAPDRSLELIERFSRLEAAASSSRRERSLSSIREAAGIERSLSSIRHRMTQLRSRSPSVFRTCHAG